MKNWRKPGLGSYQKQEQTSDSSRDGFLDPQPWLSKNQRTNFQHTTTVLNKNFKSKKLSLLPAILYQLFQRNDHFFEVFEIIKTRSSLILKYLKILKLTVINITKYPPNTGENPEKEEENRKEENIESKNIRESSGVRQAPHLGFKNLENGPFEHSTSRKNKNFPWLSKPLIRLKRNCSSFLYQPNNCTLNKCHSYL